MIVITMVCPERREVGATRRNGKDIIGRGPEDDDNNTNQSEVGEEGSAAYGTENAAEE